MYSSQLGTHSVWRSHEVAFRQYLSCGLVCVIRDGFNVGRDKDWQQTPCGGDNDDDGDDDDGRGWLDHPEINTHIVLDRI